MPYFAFFLHFSTRISPVCTFLPFPLINEHGKHLCSDSFSPYLHPTILLAGIAAKKTPVPSKILWFLRVSFLVLPHSHLCVRLAQLRQRAKWFVITQWVCKFPPELLCVLKVIILAHHTLLVTGICSEFLALGIWSSLTIHLWHFHELAWGAFYYCYPVVAAVLASCFPFLGCLVQKPPQQSFHV